MNVDYALLTDLYQITMAQGYWDAEKAGEEACFTMYFRDYPFKGGYAVACGMAQLADLVDDVLASARRTSPIWPRWTPRPAAPCSIRPSWSICAICACRWISTRCPRARSCSPTSRSCGSPAPSCECQLIETALLNMRELPNAHRHQGCARVPAPRKGRPVAEFGLRRAQGLDGGVWAARAAVVGGCASTSNVLAGKLFDIPVSGTHAHSWVMSFDDELTAFREYARIFPNNCMLLVDTYDVEQGIRNAITRGPGDARARRAPGRHPHRLGRPVVALEDGAAHAG